MVVLCGDVLKSTVVSVAHERSGPPAGDALEVLRATLLLGLTSFGGPIAHLAYFEREYVQKRRWLRPEEYAHLIALCQILPGPTSSQVGFLVGLRRAGWAGALAAWAGFTLPSAVLMYLLARALPSAPGLQLRAILHGLTLAAVVVVAQALWSMARSNCRGWMPAAIAVLSALALLLRAEATTQVAVLFGAGILGRLFLSAPVRDGVVVQGNPGTRAGTLAAATFVCLLIALPLLAARDPHGPVALASIFYRAGALVFGGGHVVLPLLHEGLAPGAWIGDPQFLAGYGFAQAMPGPLFTFAAYVGALASPSHTAVAWAAAALLAIFLPGLLLAVAGLSSWSRLARLRAFQGAITGVNAAVVGILAAAFYSPLASTTVHGPADALTTLAGLAILGWRRTASLAVVVFCVLAALLSAAVLAGR
ncbi:MAG TPA: chromate efflux transporter [Steroidobacteraceae bacterium]|nr:chromate efflux transporter [Steroidobacteraceae bacterium]